MGYSLRLEGFSNGYSVSTAVLYANNKRYSASSGQVDLSDISEVSIQFYSAGNFKEFYIYGVLDSVSGDQLKSATLTGNSRLYWVSGSVSAGNTMYLVRMTYTLSYYTKHGIAPESMSGISDLTDTMLVPLTKEGYNFLGWFYDSSFTAPAQVGDALSADTTLYAKWEKSGEWSGGMLDVTYNSTKIIDAAEVTPPVAITYNGNTIATLNEGDTKTLQCNGKVMQSDVVLEYGGGSTGETWYFNELIAANNSMAFDIGFSSWEEEYEQLSVTVSGGIQILYGSTSVYYRSFTSQTGWVDSRYRTIALDEPATGDFLTWLQSNAVKETSNDGATSTKTLQCSGKLMASDVVVEVGGVTPPPVTGETWVINENLYLSAEISVTVGFESAGQRYQTFEYNIKSPGEQMPYPYRQMLMYDYNLRWYDGTWESPSYRTITLDEPATGGFLTWLQNNAVKQ